MFGLALVLLNPFIQSEVHSFTSFEHMTGSTIKKVTWRWSRPFWGLLCHPWARSCQEKFRIWNIYGFATPPHCHYV